jgi:hypothetical protein
MRAINWVPVISMIDRQVAPPVSLGQALSALEELQEQIESRIDGLKADIENENNSGG